MYLHLEPVINYELGGEGQTQIQETGSHDLVKGGKIGFRARRSGQEQLWFTLQNQILM